MSLSILVVEDDPIARGAMERLLLLHGHRMLWAATTLAAIDLLRTEPVDLVLLDFELDGSLNGSYVAKHVARKVPVFMISGYDVSYMREAVSNTLEGVTLFFAKPVDTEELMVAVERVERTKNTP